MVAPDVGGGLRLGDLAPTWVLPRLDGDELELQSLRGRKVVLFFWGSW